MKTTVGLLPSEIGVRWDIGVAWRRQFERGVYSLMGDVNVTNTGTAIWLPQDAPYGGVSLGVHMA